MLENWRNLSALWGFALKADLNNQRSILEEDRLFDAVYQRIEQFLAQIFSRGPLAVIGFILAALIMGAASLLVLFSTTVISPFLFKAASLLGVVCLVLLATLSVIAMTMDLRERTMNNKRPHEETSDGVVELLPVPSNSLSVKGGSPEPSAPPLQNSQDPEPSAPPWQNSQDPEPSAQQTWMAPPPPPYPGRQDGPPVK